MQQQSLQKKKKYYSKNQYLDLEMINHQERKKIRLSKKEITMLDNSTNAKQKQNKKCDNNLKSLTSIKVGDKKSSCNTQQQRQRVNEQAKQKQIFPKIQLKKITKNNQTNTNTNTNQKPPSNTINNTNTTNTTNTNLSNKRNQKMNLQAKIKILKEDISKTTNHNGFTTTPNIFQIIPVLVIFFLIIEIVFVEIIVVISIMVIIMAPLIYFWYLATSINPTDQVQIQHRAFIQNPYSLTQFNPSKHKYFCNLCKTCVGSKAFHCNKCNRCVQYFDHHCRWLNNCIGSRNYVQFVTLIALTQLFLIFCTAINIWMTASLSTEQNFSSSPKMYMLIIGHLTQIIPLIAVSMLLFLHIYLLFSKKTTIDLILQSRNKKNKVRPQIYTKNPILVLEKNGGNLSLMQFSASLENSLKTPSSYNDKSIAQSHGKVISKIGLKQNLQSQTAFFSSYFKMNMNNSIKQKQIHNLKDTSIIKVNRKKTQKATKKSKVEQEQIQSQEPSGQSLVMDKQRYKISQHQHQHQQQGQQQQQQQQQNKSPQNQNQYQHEQGSSEQKHSDSSNSDQKQDLDSHQQEYFNQHQHKHQYFEQQRQQNVNQSQLKLRKQDQKKEQELKQQPKQKQKKSHNNNNKSKTEERKVSISSHISKTPNNQRSNIRQTSYKQQSMQVRLENQEIQLFKLFQQNKKKQRQQSFTIAPKANQINDHGASDASSNHKYHNDNDNDNEIVVDFGSLNIENQSRYKEVDFDFDSNRRNIQKLENQMQIHGSIDEDFSDIGSDTKK